MKKLKTVPQSEDRNPRGGEKKSKPASIACVESAGGGGPIPNEIEMQDGKRPKRLDCPGEVNQALVDELTRRFTPDLIADKIQDLLEAKRVVGKGGPLVDDARATESGLKLMLAYAIGLPVQRQEQIVRNFDSVESLKEKLKSSPELRKSMRELMKEFEDDDQAVQKTGSENGTPPKGESGWDS